MQNAVDLIKYNDGEIEQAIYNEEELFENSTIRKFRIVQKEGKRNVSRKLLKNLDKKVAHG